MSYTEKDIARDADVWFERLYANEKEHFHTLLRRFLAQEKVAVRREALEEAIDVVLENAAFQFDAIRLAAKLRALKDGAK